MNANATESKSRSLLNRCWDWAFLVVTILITAWAIFQTRYWYILGSSNRDGYINDKLLFVWFSSCIFWLIPPCWAFLRLVLRQPRWTNGLLFLAVSFLPLAIGLTINFLNEPGVVQHRNGFQVWIVSNVDPVPIQSWLATQPRSDDVIWVPPADWPPVIQRLEPERVDLWRGQGVALSWGKTGHDGSRRQVFVNRTADSSPPSEVLWVDDSWNDAWVPVENSWPSNWRSAKPGVWWWLWSGG